MAVLHDAEGRLHSGRALALIAALVFLIGLATSLMLFVSGAVGTEALVIGGVIIFLVVKVPLLGIVWWLMGRHLERPGEQRWSAEERAEILAYLEREAARAVGRPDASKRLAYLSREAWNVADHSPAEEKAGAVATALRIRSLAGPRRSATPPGRPPSAS
jgi:hypothetical protein